MLLLLLSFLLFTQSCFAKFNVTSFPASQVLASRFSSAEYETLTSIKYPSVCMNMCIVEETCWSVSYSESESICVMFPRISAEDLVSAVGYDTYTYSYIPDDVDDQAALEEALRGTGLIVDVQRLWMFSKVKIFITVTATIIFVHYIVGGFYMPHLIHPWGGARATTHK